MRHKNDQIEISRPTWVEVDLNAIRRNHMSLKRYIDKKIQMLCVVKANAYGHGAIPVTKVLQKQGVNLFGAANVDEAIRLRNNSIKASILVFEHALPEQASDIIRYNLVQTVGNIRLARALDSCARKMKCRAHIHIKIDTGMGRLGVWHNQALSFIRQISKLKNVRITGIYTHFPVADTDKAFTKEQITKFTQLTQQLKKSGINISYLHVANSMGLVGYNMSHFNLIRPGLMLYGLYPIAKLKSKITVTPAMSVKSKIVFLKKMAKGRGVSYGHTFVAKKNTVIATLPIGYNDGYLRCLSNRASVLINGQRCPVVGRVTMDQLMVDVSRIKSAKVGMEAVLLGRQKGEYISADELASKANTINYEIICSLGNRLPHIYKS